MLIPFGEVWVIVGATATRKSCTARYDTGLLMQEFMNENPHIPRSSCVMLIDDCDYIDKHSRFPNSMLGLQNEQEYTKL